MAHRSRTQEEHKQRAHQMLASAGNPMKHADAKQDRALIKQELKAHVKGDALTKLAKGGAAKAKKGVTINIIHGDEQAAAQRGLQQGMQVGARMGAQQAAQHAPMSAPPGAGPGGPPPGAPPMPPPRPPMGAPGAPPMGGGMKKGGTVKVREHTRRVKAKGPFDRGGKKPFDE